VDSDWSTFGGFTPVEWQSPFLRTDKTDLTLKSFLFTLRNPHNFPARKSALKAEVKDQAILCASPSGPCLAGIVVLNHCNVDNSIIGSRIWRILRQRNQPARGKLFTGSQTFKAKEIEVFSFSASPLEIIGPNRNLTQVAFDFDLTRSQAT
jgi:hypothetical protein